MYRKELFQTLRNVLNISIISVLLVGCLSKSSGSNFVDQPTTQSAQPSAPTGNRTPTISGIPSTAINFDNAYMFMPTAIDPDGDQLNFSIKNQPPWAEFNNTSGELSGQPSLGHVGTYANIEISVTDGSAEAKLPMFAISVDQTGTISTTLSWMPPTQNDDGSPLMDLAGYKIYWGTVRGQYTHSATINNPGMSSYVVENLSPGTYEFAGTSFNQAGVESEYSNPVTKVLN
ncbi:MAG: putative Ig domain-containing protein [Woeseiaceae bacterium]